MTTNKTASANEDCRMWWKLWKKAIRIDFLFTKISWESWRCVTDVAIHHLCRMDTNKPYRSVSGNMLHWSYFKQLDMKHCYKKPLLVLPQIVLGNLYPLQSVISVKYSTTAALPLRDALYLHSHPFSPLLTLKPNTTELHAKPWRWSVRLPILPDPFFILHSSAL